MTQPNLPGGNQGYQQFQGGGQFQGDSQFQQAGQFPGATQSQGQLSLRLTRRSQLRRRR